MFIGIDLGTSSIKMILIDQNQSILASANSSLTVQSPKDGLVNKIHKNGLTQQWNAWRL